MDKNNVAGYVRVSTSQQVETGTSIDDQIKNIEKEAERRGWEKPAFYKDEGISGKSDKRPALQLMLSDIRTKKFHAIIFTKIDRLARNLRDTLNIYHEAEKYGVAMVCLDNPVISTDGPMGSVMLQVMGAFAQFERDLIRSRTVAGRMAKWKKGEAIMGNLPFGYYQNKENNKIEIDQEKVKIIQKIYHLYLDNRLSMLDVAGKLTDDRIPTPSMLIRRKDASSSWNMNSVREILINQAYTGVSINYNQYKYKWSDNNKIYKSNEKKEKDEWVTYQFPKIIEKEVFEQVQARINHNKAIPKKNHKGCEDKFLADKFLRCGHCKAKISKQTTGTRKFIYYTCPWRRASTKQLKVKNQAKCVLPFLDSDRVDAAIFTKITNLITNPGKYSSEWLKNQPIDELEKKIELLSDENAKLTSKVSRAINIELNTDDIRLQEIYRKEREKIEGEYQAVSRKLIQARNELSFYKNKVEKLQQFENIFKYPKREHAMRMKFAISSALKKLPFHEKKRLVEAVISPETGGCVYVRELTPADIGLPGAAPVNDAGKPVHGSKVGERDFVLEFDFTMEPYRIIDIIRTLTGDVFRIGEQ